MPGYTVTVTGPPVVGDAECYCREWEPCQSCEDAADGLVGAEVYDSGVGGRTFTVAGADSQGSYDGRLTVFGGGVWAYLDDVRPLISRQTVETLHEAQETAVRLIWKTEPRYSISFQAVSDALHLPDAGGEIELPDGSTITVEPAGEADAPSAG